MIALKRPKENTSNTELKLVDRMKDIMKEDNNIEEEIEENKSGGWSPTSSPYPTPTPVIETDEVVEETNTTDEESEPEPEPEPEPEQKISTYQIYLNLNQKHAPDGEYSTNRRRGKRRRRKKML